MAYQKIINSSKGDEELLIPNVEEIEAMSNNLKLQKPPKCGLCGCNTKCGSYLISVLQLIHGFFAITLVLFSVTDAELPHQNDKPIPVYTRKLYWISIIGIYSIVAGVFALHGITSKKGGYLKPSIFLHMLSMVGGTCQLFLVCINWNSIAENLRTFLLAQCESIENMLKDNLYIDDTVESRQELQSWDQTYYMIKNDDYWNQYSKSFFMCLFSTVVLFHVLYVAWFLWVLMAHKAWMYGRGHK